MMSSGGLTRRLLLGAIADQEPETKRTSSRPSLFGEFPESSVETAGQLVPEGGPLPGCVWAVVKYPQRFGSLPARERNGEMLVVTDTIVYFCLCSYVLNHYMTYIRA